MRIDVVWVRVKNTVMRWKMRFRVLGARCHQWNNTQREHQRNERKNILCINFFFHFHLEHSRRLRSVGSHCSWVLIFQSFVCSREGNSLDSWRKKIARKLPFGANKEQWRCWHQPLCEDIIPNLRRAQSLERNFQCSDELSFLFFGNFHFS